MVTEATRNKKLQEELNKVKELLEVTQRKLADHSPNEPGGSKKEQESGDERRKIDEVFKTLEEDEYIEFTAEMWESMLAMILELLAKVLRLGF